jgi:hypothetical protein
MEDDPMEHGIPIADTANSLQQNSESPSVPFSIRKDYGSRVKSGVALIFNQMNFNKCNVVTKKGSSKDADDLKRLLSERGFCVKVHTDYTKAAILQEISKSES